jgi:tetratricopeptide (TPR) repeat protein
VAIKMPGQEEMQREKERRRLDQNRAAVSKLQDEIAAGNDDANTWYTAGVANLNLGEFATARDAFLKAVERDRTFLQAWTNLAAAHYELGEFAEAVVVSKRAMEVRPGFLPARMNFAMSSLKLANFADAEVQFRAILQAEPEMPTALAGMTRAMIGLGHSEDAAHYKVRAVQAGVCFVEDE